jgi:hypothetical protein
MESAAMRYKEIVGLAAKATNELRAWENIHAQELDARIAGAEAALEQAKEREQRAEQTVRNWWRMTADNVARLSWLELGEEPAPAANAPASWLDRHLNEVKQVYSELVDAVLSLGWRARR